MDKDFEVLAFPDLFPYGTGGNETDEPCQSKFTLHQYFQQRLLNVDCKFVENIKYLFCTQHATDLEQIKAKHEVVIE